MNKQTVILTQDQAEALLKEWQKILRLQDWDVVVGIRRARDMSLGESAAEVHWKKEKKLAIIHLLDPTDYDNACFSQDHEVSIVHELLHLHMVGFAAEDDTPEDTAQEQAIHAISMALVELKRRGHKPPITMVRGDNGARIELQTS